MESITSLPSVARSRRRTRLVILMALPIAAGFVGSRSGLLRAQADVPTATIDRDLVTLRPSGAAFRLPEHMISGSQTHALTTYLTRPDLERVKAPPRDEWDRPFSAIVNTALPFDRCAAHIGTEPFGSGRSFSDLQMRAYVLDSPAKPVLDAIFGLGQKKTEEFFGGATTTVSQLGSWRLGSIAYLFRHADYGANARVDFYLREFGRQTAVLVFMYSPSPRWPWDADISAIVGSFTWPTLSSWLLIPARPSMHVYMQDPNHP